ncbi:MAG TPA: Na+/H+ antiporter [Thermomicrobiales bacterium]|nr:Na+/H+ antiporter [Thermomicrobiales bacterium]
MDIFELIVTLVLSVVILIWLADRLSIPYPMFLMAGGLVLGVIPWTPSIELNPEIVLIVFLPPVLFQAAQTTSIREFRADFSSISRLAVGLVVVSTALVAIVAHWVIPGISWPAAFVLGAVVSPPDAVAATVIFQRLGAPRRIVTILEGESLINDASALVVYTFAVAAVVTGSFSWSEALSRFVIVVIVGVAVGIGIGWVLGRAVSILGDPSLAAVVTLIAPVGAYLLAEKLDGSGVLAVVVAGLVHGYQGSHTLSPETRVRALAIWDLITIVINGFIFILIGFELGALRLVFADQSVWSLVWHGAAVVAAMLVARFLYVFLGDLLPGANKSQAFAGLGMKGQFLIAWSGLRGVVSLATALAIPLTTDTGLPFDHRDEIILITAGVIVFTLFGLGLPLPWLLQRLNLADDRSYDREMRLARRATSQAMSSRLQMIVAEHPRAKEALQPMLREMRVRLESNSHAVDDHRLDEIHNLLEERVGARLQMIAAARETLLELRDRGEIGDEVRREMERRLDLQELQLAG